MNKQGLFPYTCKCLICKRDKSPSSWISTNLFWIQEKLIFWLRSIVILAIWIFFFKSRSHNNNLWRLYIIIHSNLVDFFNTFFKISFAFQNNVTFTVESRFLMSENNFKTVSSKCPLLTTKLLLGNFWLFLENCLFFLLFFSICYLIEQIHSTLIVVVVVCFTLSLQVYATC